MALSTHTPFYASHCFRKFRFVKTYILKWMWVISFQISKTGDIFFLSLYLCQQSQFCGFHWFVLWTEYIIHTYNSYGLSNTDLWVHKYSKCLHFWGKLFQATEHSNTCISKHINIPIWVALLSKLLFCDTAKPSFQTWDTQDEIMSCGDTSVGGKCYQKAREI